MRPSSARALVTSPQRPISFILTPTPAGPRPGLQKNNPPPPGATMSRITLTLSALFISLALAPSVQAADPDAVPLHPVTRAPAVSVTGPSNTSEPATDPRAAKAASRLREITGQLKAEAAKAKSADNTALPSRQRQAIARLRARLGAELDIRGIEQAGTPRQIRGAILEPASSLGATPKSRDEKTARAFLRNQKDVLRLDNPDTEMKLLKHEEDELSRRHLRYEQRFKGLTVWPAELMVHIDPTGNVDALDGAYVPTPRNTETTPVVSEESAIVRARREVKASDDATVSKPELLVYAPGDRTPRLAWKMTVEVSASARWLVVIDALNGATLKAYNQIMRQGVSGSGRDVLGIVRPLNLWQQGSTFFWWTPASPCTTPRPPRRPWCVAVSRYWTPSISRLPMIPLAIWATSPPITSVPRPPMTAGYRTR